MILAVVMSFLTLWAILIQDLSFAIALLVVTGSLWAGVLQGSEWAPGSKEQR